MVAFFRAFGLAKLLTGRYRDKGTTSEVDGLDKWKESYSADHMLSRFSSPNLDYLTDLELLSAFLLV